MRILIIGARGLIGSSAAARLISEGHQVIGAGRRAAEVGLIAISWVRIDVARATDPGDWKPLLGGIDAVLNCAGTLQDAPGESTEGVHSSGINALIRACAEAGVRRFVHLSAIGVDRETPTSFSKAKLAGDNALMSSDLDWVILRPSVVMGRPACGGSALMRGLASLPVLPVMPNTAPLQVVHLNDVLDAIAFFLQPNAPSRCAIELVGPRRYSFEDIVALLRKWMRWPAARKLPVPAWLAGLAYRLGDFVALLGWRPPVRTTAGKAVCGAAVIAGAQVRNRAGGDEIIHPPYLLPRIVAGETSAHEDIYRAPGAFYARKTDLGARLTQGNVAVQRATDSGSLAPVTTRKGYSAWTGQRWNSTSSRRSSMSPAERTK